MQYYITDKDYGQGKGLTALPVSEHIKEDKPVENRPYSAYEVLTEFYGEDMGAYLGNYVTMEIETIQDKGVMKKAQEVRLKSYQYLMTKSKLLQDTHETVVDFLVKANLSGSDEASGKVRTEQSVFRMRYILDMKPCHPQCIGPIINLYDKNEADYLDDFQIPTNEYLLPIMYAEDYRTMAYYMMNYYYPEAKERIANRDFVLDPDDLVERMGLKLHEVRFADSTTLGQLYYNEGIAELLDDNDKPYKVRVRPFSILISKDNCASKGVRNSTIIHECCHLFLDRWYFLLQMMAGRRESGFINRRREKKRSFKKKSPIEWMELQCDKLPAYLLLEERSCMAFAKKCLLEYEGRITPANIRSVISKVAEHFGVSFSMARYRLIELGFTAAQGIGNYVDHNTVPDHCCAGTWEKGITYTLSMDDAFKVWDENPSFANLLKQRKYVYVESHFCLNDKKYILSKWDGGFRLTDYARSHIDECCLSFRAFGRNITVKYENGCVARRKTEAVTDKYRSGYEFVAEPGTAEYDKENSIFADDSWLWGDFYYEMSDDYKEAIMEIMKRKGVTQEKLAGYLDVDRKVIYNCLNAINPSKPHLVAICIALKLPYHISEKILQNAGITFRKTELDHIYRSFLISADKLNIERCDDILRQMNYQTLFERVS